MPKAFWGISFLILISFTKLFLPYFFQDAAVASLKIATGDIKMTVRRLKL